MESQSKRSDLSLEKDNTTSFEVIHSDIDCNESNVDSVEFSFLPKNDLLPALLIATPDLTLEEVQHRLLVMFRENEELKEALKKNNVMMHEQWSIASSWHEQMLQAKNKQQFKIDEATKLICELQKHNAELVNQIWENAKMDSCSKCTDLESVLSNLEMEKQNFIKEKEDCSELNQQKLSHKQLENNISSISSSLENLQSNSKLLVEEKNELTALNNELQVQLASLNCEMGALKDAMLQLHELEENVHDLTRQLEEKDIEITSLKQKTTDQEQEILKFQEAQKTQEEVVKASYELAQDKLEIATSLSQKYKDRCDILQQQMDEDQAKLEQMKISDSYVIEQLQDEVKKLQEVLKFEQTNNEEDKKKLLDAENNIKMLSNEFETVKKLLDIQEQEQEKNSNISNSLTAKLSNSEKKLKAEQNKVKDLMTELRTLKQDAESISVLKSQIEVYKTDFKNETAARKSAQDRIKVLEQKILSENRKHSSGRFGDQAGPKISMSFVDPSLRRMFNGAEAIEDHCDTYSIRSAYLTSPSGAARCSCPNCH